MKGKGRFQSAFGANWNNALAVVVLSCVLAISFAPSMPLGAEGNTGGSFTVEKSISDLGDQLERGIPSPANVAVGANKQCAAAGQPCKTTGLWGEVEGTCVTVGVCRAAWYTEYAKTLGSGGVAVVTAQILLNFKTSLFGGGPTKPGAPSTGTPQCTGYYRVTVRTSDPCAIYIPPTSSSQLPQNTSSQLLDSLRSPSIGDALLFQANKVGTPSPAPVQNQIAPLPSGAKGGIQLTATGISIQAGVRDVSRNTESAGFFASNVPQNTQPQGFIERICLVRPWQSPLISYSIPASLFDNLCSSKGLRAGVLPGAAASVTVPVSTQPKAVAPTATSTTPSIALKADIWAVPVSVPFGARTSIFWNAKGVSSCVVSSPDGTLSEKSISGNVATAPLTGPTFFIISCLAPDGSRVNNYVKVNTSS
ncbi:MAG: hypothetical protein AAB830_02990 [Patescibacteria group bacterium]